ncbi:MAG TPA: MOP flippase family protein [Terracidiphilus sp.]|nr:MOP flippase family protein [Terracidiphilus sp.]
MRETVTLDNAQGPGATLTQKATVGVAWTGLFQISRQLLSLLSISVLARHISPSAYGLIAMATVLTNFLDTVRDLGTTSALVREPNLSDRLLSTMFWFNCLLGLLLTLCVVGLSFPAALFFHEPALAKILQALSITFVITATSVVPNALLTRRMAFREIAITQFAGAVTGTGVAIGIALNGGGVWSLVFASLASTTMTAVAFWVFGRRRYQWVLDWKESRSIRSFSLGLSGFNVLNYFSRNADNLIVGRFLGKDPLGFYNMAYTLMTYPLSNFSAVICQVLFPALAKVQDDNQRFRSAYCRTCALIGLATFPAMLGVTVVADPLVRVVLGERWLPVAGLLRVFGPLGMAQSVFTTTGLIYQAKGRADWLLRWGLVSATVYVASFFLGLPWGIQGVAISYSIAWTILMVPGFLIPFRLIELPAREFALQLWPGLKASLIMALVAAAWLMGLERMGVHGATIQLFSTAAIGALSYLAILWWRQPPAVGELRTLLLQSGNGIAMRVASWLT